MSIPAHRQPVVAVFGSSTLREGDPAWRAAHDLGAQLARRGCATMTGGYDGAMAATSRGAREAGGHVIGVTVDLFGAPASLPAGPALLAMLTTEEVSRFISPPPTTVEGFERFIVWTHRERHEGRYACFAVVPHGSDHAVGIFQIRQLDFNFETAEWGFALGAEYWGTGVFVDAAREVLDFVFGTLNVHRLEARSALGNGRGNSAILKARSRSRGRAAEGLPPERQVARPEHVVDPRRGLVHRSRGAGSLRRRAKRNKRTTRRAGDEPALLCLWSASQALLKL